MLSKRESKGLCKEHLALGQKERPRGKPTGFGQFFLLIPRFLVGFWSVFPFTNMVFVGLPGQFLTHGPLLSPPAAAPGTSGGFGAPKTLGDLHRAERQGGGAPGVAQWVFYGFSKVFLRFLRVF